MPMIENWWRHARREARALAARLPLTDALVEGASKLACEEEWPRVTAWLRQKQRTLADLLRRNTRNGWADWCAYQLRLPSPYRRALWRLVGIMCTRDARDRLHSIGDRPALLERHERDGRLYRAAWARHGPLHRDDGPAEVLIPWTVAGHDRPLAYIKWWRHGVPGAGRLHIPRRRVVEVHCVRSDDTIDAPGIYCKSHPGAWNAAICALGTGAFAAVIRSQLERRGRGLRTEARR